MTIIEQDPTQPEHYVTGEVVRSMYYGYVQLVFETIHQPQPHSIPRIYSEPAKARKMLTSKLTGMVNQAKQDMLGDRGAELIENEQKELIVSYCDLAARTVLHEEIADLKQFDPTFRSLSCPINMDTIDKIEAYSRTHKEALSTEELLPDFFGQSAG